MFGRAVLPLTLLSLGLAACGGSAPETPVDAPPVPIDGPVDAAVDAFVIPTLRNPLPDLDDAALAEQAMALMGQDSSKNCDQCHGLSRGRMRSWETETDVAVQRCFSNTMPETQGHAMAIVNCFREIDGDPGSRFSPERLGIYATGADLAWFRYVFNLAYGAEGETQLGFFLDEALMPRGGGPTFTQGEFDVITEWFSRGLPDLETVVAADPPPGSCTNMISPDVATHVQSMRQQGWRAINQDNGMTSFGCAGATGPRGCLSTFPKPADRAYAAGWEAAEPEAKIRILREQSYASAYWTRGSADGRYVAQGGGTGSAPYRSTVIDLMTDREIPAAAQYDPAFSPDNIAWMLQGSSARICEQSLLNNQPAMVSFNEPQCSQTNSIALYQHIGAARGGDYWAVAGQFQSDNAGHNTTLSDPAASSTSTSKITLTPFVHTGTQFTTRPGIQIATPREGDVVLSGTAKLLVGRLNGGGGSQSGFLLRKLIATPFGNSYQVDAPEIARYCLRGGKPGFSLDDRWMTYHHVVESGDWQAMGYASADDPAWLALRARGAANIYLLDLVTGVSKRITTMNAGQYALYPFFRSDGWIYFLVRDDNRGREYIVASDAALEYEGL